MGHRSKQEMSETAKAFMAEVYAGVDPTPARERRTKRARLVMTTNGKVRSAR